MNTQENSQEIKSILSSWFPNAKINESNEMGSSRQLHQFSINDKNRRNVVSIQEDILKFKNKNEIHELLYNLKLLKTINENPNRHIILYTTKIIIESLNEQPS